MQFKRPPLLLSKRGDLISLVLFDFAPSDVVIYHRAAGRYLAVAALGSMYVFSLRPQFYRCTTRNSRSHFAASSFTCARNFSFSDTYFEVLSALITFNPFKPCRRSFKLNRVTTSTIRTSACVPFFLVHNCFSFQTSSFLLFDFIFSPNPQMVSSVISANSWV